METTSEKDSNATNEQRFLEAAELGKDKRTFTIYGNEVSLHTLTIKETLEASLAAKPYIGTKAEWVALKTAIVALSIDTINDSAFYTPISVDEPTAQRRFKKLSDNYYSDFISACYEKYMEMENEQRDILDKLKKAQA